MSATNKVGTQLLLRPAAKTGIQALAVIRGETQAETMRVLMDQAVQLMEKNYAGELERIHIALAAMKVNYATGVEAMIRGKIGVDALYNDDGTVRSRFPGQL